MTPTRPSIRELLAPGATREPNVIASVPVHPPHDEHPHEARGFVEQAAPAAPPVLEEPWERFDREAWYAYPATRELVSGVPVWAPHVDLPFVVVHQDDLVDIGAGVPVVHGERVFFALSPEDPVFRVRTGLGTRLVEITGGEISVYDDPADEEPWLDPPLGPWLFDRAAPEWIRGAVAERCAVGTLFHAFCGVGLCLRHAARSAQPSLAATLDAIRTRQRPVLHQRVLAWLEQPRVGAGLPELESTALHLAQALAERLLGLDLEGGLAPELALVLMTDRDDLESARVVLRLVGRAESLEELLVEVDEVAAGRLLLLEDAVARWDGDDAVLGAACVLDDTAWWGLP